MVQTVCTISVSTGEKKIILEKPHRLRRIFFSIKIIAPPEPMCKTMLSFDDPRFTFYYILAGVVKYFQSEGADIFQGNMWIKNVSGGDLEYTASETLREYYSILR